jgi:hypothetical protein
MKNKTITFLCAAALGVAAATPGFAGQSPGADEVAADAVVMRPALFAATVLGSAIFVVSLPAAAISHSVKSSAHTLVVAPARATFKRPLGDFHYNPAPRPVTPDGRPVHF